MSNDGRLPGSRGEHDLQESYGTASRARRFYDTHMLDHLNEDMQEFIGRMEMAFIATSDGEGECDCSFRAGLPGFVHVLDPRTVAYPEYRGNGVMASLGNINENAHIGILFVDFFRDTVGLHVNGRARVVENQELARMEGAPLALLEDVIRGGGRQAERWVVVHVEEAYVHCSKHIPLLAKQDRSIAWGSDDEVRKGGDYFRARGVARPWYAPAADRQP